ncbi:MAG: peptidoglycan-binding domain-containing protein, partial [Trebonia sp.]
MSSTDAREQAGGPAVPEPAAPGAVNEMSGPLVPSRGGGHAAGVPAAGGLPTAGHRRRGRGWIAVVAVVVVAAAGVGGADAAGVFRAAKPAGSGNAYATGTAAVKRGSLTEQAQENGTLGGAGAYSVVVAGSSGSGGAGSPSAGSGAATFTWLPQAAQIIRQGQVLYEVNETAVVLLYGSVPAYRDLSEGMTGGDVRELNADLAKLGYATAAALGPVSGWDYFSSETAYALGLLQSHLGLTVTGSLPLGQAVFLPGAIEV